MSSSLTLAEQLTKEAEYERLLAQARSLQPHLQGDQQLLLGMITACRERQASLTTEPRWFRWRHRRNRSWTPEHEAKDGSDAIRPSYTLYLDETGVTKMDAYKPTPGFTLCGVLLKEGAETEALTNTLREFKLTHIGRDDVPLHWHHIRHKKGDFGFLGDSQRSNRFYASLHDILANTDFIIIAATVQKQDYQAQFGSGPADSFLPALPYSLCLNFVIERFLHFLWNHGQASARVVAESRGRSENSQLQMEYLRLQLEGTQYISEKWIRYHLRPVIKFHRKEDCIPGLELADVVSPVTATRSRLREGKVKRWDLVKSKVYDGGEGRPESYGLKIFPIAATGDMF